MWNQNQKSSSEIRKNASTSGSGNRNLREKEEEDKKAKGLEEKDSKTEIENQSSGIDSGFLSGPQLSIYDDSENSEGAEGGGDHSESESSNKKKDNQNNKRKQQQEGEDNKEKEYLDSGCLEDIDKDRHNENREDSNNKPMLLDSGIDLGLTEWFCNLSLKNSNNIQQQHHQQQQPLNNLGSGGQTSNKKRVSTDANILGTTTVSAAASTSGRKDNNQNNTTRKRPNWEIYFQQNGEGDTQLHLACIAGYIDVVAALIRMAIHPCLLDIQNDNAQAAIHLAVLTGQANIVRLLVVSGAEVNIRDSNGNTPAHLACISGDMDCIKALTIPVNSIEIQEATRMNLLKNPNNTGISSNKRYIQQQQLPSDLEQRNYDGQRCVHLATQENHIDILRYLVRCGADINAREGKSGQTPLHIAIERCNEILANFLMEECQKINLETETYAGLTAYQLAAIAHNNQILINLQQKGAEPLTPPDSDVDDDSDADDFMNNYENDQMHNFSFGDPGFFVSSSAHNGMNSINVA